MNLLRSHLPPLSDWSAAGIMRESDSIKATVCSAALAVLPSGELMTSTPHSVAIGTSMLSTPTPARPITFRFLPARMTSAVTFERLLTKRASYSADGLDQIGSADVGLIGYTQLLLENIDSLFADFIGNENSMHFRFRSSGRVFSHTLHFCSLSLTGQNQFVLHLLFGLRG